MAANQNLFAGMNTYDSTYAPINMDESSEDEGPKVGSLFDMAAPTTSQGSQGASMDPFGSKNPSGQQKMATPYKQSATGSLFDEDDILGMIQSNDPLSLAAQQSAKAVAAQGMAPMMSQQEAIFGQKQLIRPGQGAANPNQQYGNGQLPTDLFSGVGGAPRTQEEEKKLEISENHYQDNRNGVSGSQNQAQGGGMFSRVTSMFYGPQEDLLKQPGQFTSFGSEQIGTTRKSWFQRWIFDFTTYSYMFETTTSTVISKLKDATWPFRPENQPTEVNPENAQGHRRTSALSPNEMYGPLWIMFTLIVSVLIMGHIVKTLRSTIGYGLTGDQEIADSLLVDQVIKRYGGIGEFAFDPSAVNANQALKNIMRIFFLVFMFFALVPFGTYLVFISSLEGAPRSYQTSWVRQIQIYGYSMASFIPFSMLLVILSPFYRAKWILLFATVGMVTFYQYKEGIETCKKYLIYSKFVKLAVALVIANLLFGLLVKGIVSTSS